MLDLRELKHDVVTETSHIIDHGKDERQSKNSADDLKVYLMDTRDPNVAGDFESHHYVSLSHRWGVPEGVQPTRLVQNNLNSFKQGMRLGDLPRTFRDAIQLAARIPNVRYIWIDSLCIIQDSTTDWLHEAALMQKVYSHSHVNISATFSENSAQGLYSDRNASHLWEDEVNLNIQGLPGSIVERVQDNHSPHESQVVTTEGGKTRPAYIRRCTIVDVSLWDSLVNHASVNRRGWVVQERLLSRRVLHFCDGQIAWECSELEAAEGLPLGVPNYQIQGDTVYADTRTRIIEPTIDGAQLRRNRLGESIEPDSHLLPGIYAFEVWNRIVETYSKTALTMPADKLIAMSGMAAKMSEAIKSDYIAGLWRKHLPSQLLWRVEPVFHRASWKPSTPGYFINLSKRPEKYRAPSFSWAAIDANLGNGIVCGEVTDQDILVDIVSAEATKPHETGDNFGLVDGAKIELWGQIRPARLEKLSAGKHSWFLRDRKIAGLRLDLERHANVYLDCPDEDDRLHSIFDSDDVYCLPVAMGPRIEPEGSKYILCLLLVHAAESPFNPLGAGPGTFRGIGMTKLSPWIDKLAHQHILKNSPPGIEIPHIGDNYDEDTGKYLICLI